MTTIADIARRPLCGLLLLLAAMLLSSPLPAQDLSARIDEASRAADAASEAADAALAAANAAAGEGLAAAAVDQALRAAQAAQAAADASTRALEAARAATGGTATAATAATGTTMAAAAGAAGAPPYEGHIRCEGGDCKVDLWMIRGFRAFSQCQVCHGLEGQGSTIAPSLLDKLKEIDKARFVEVVTNGYQGQIGVMPGWKENPNVMDYMEQLYAYLKARSDGTLPGGRPTRYDR